MQAFITQWGPVLLGLLTSGMLIGFGTKFIAGLAWVRAIKKGQPASVAAHAAIEVLEVIDKEDDDEPTKR